VPTPAKTDGGAPGEAEGLALRIDNLEIAFHADGPVVVHRYFRRCHFFSLRSMSMPTLSKSGKQKREALQTGWSALDL
jgi:hypothetical protein